MPEPTTPTGAAPLVYGLWNIAGRCWIVSDSGRQFQTDHPDVALDALARLRAGGAAGIEVRVIPHDEVETIALPDDDEDDLDDEAAFLEALMNIDCPPPETERKPNAEH